MTRAPGSESSACFAGPHSPWSPSLAPPTSQRIAPRCSPACRVGRDVAIPTPHRTGRAELPLTGSSRESFAHSGVAMTPSVTRLSRNALASSAIRCRFVDRFARPKVLSHVARQRFSPRDASLSSIGSRRDQFPDVVSTMRALRLPTHASPVTYLFRFRGPRDSSSVRARRCRRSRADGGPATGQDPCSAGDPICRRALTWT